METLLVLGAGPKAVAIGAKLHVLRELGWQVPSLKVVDRTGVAAHWTGEAGYSDGTPLLGTSPYRDVGFPYNTTCLGTPAQRLHINQQMLRWSWQSYLAHRQEYWRWLDRGARWPSHGDWAAYLGWVAERTGLDVHVANVTSIRRGANGRWQLHVSRHGRREIIEGDGLVITGSGTPRPVPGQPEMDTNRYSDGCTFWQRIDDIQALGDGISVGVLGLGGTAAGIVVRLLDLAFQQPNLNVTMIGPSGVIFSRGEGFDELRMFSMPEPDWPVKPFVERREYIRRTDEGVFAHDTLKRIDDSPRVVRQRGRVERIELSPTNVTVSFARGWEVEPIRFDYVVNAIGFDRLWFMRLLVPESRSVLREHVHAQVGDARSRPQFRRIPKVERFLAFLETAIDHDLSVTGFQPRLHLPMVAGVSQGPGFPGLRSLGHLADRVLKSYVRPPGAI